MAFGFGQGVNAALGRTDYTPFLAGAQQGAGMAAQGAAAIGQGIAGLGAGIGMAAEKKKQETEKKKMLTSSIKAAKATFNAVKDNPSVPEAVKQYLATSVAQLDNPELSLMDQAAIAEPLNQRFNAVLNAGLQQMLAPGPSAMDVANLEKTQAEIGKIKAETTALGRPKPENLSFQEQTARAKVAAFTEANGRPPSSAELAQINESVIRSSVPQPPAAQTAYGQTVGAEAAKDQFTTFTQAKQAVESIPKLDQVLTILEQGDPSTGIFAEIENNVNRVRAMFGSPEAIAKVKDTEILDALLGSDVFPMIGALGIGARGLDTPAERDYLRKVMTGEIKMNKESLIRLTEIRRDIQERAINKFNKSVESGEFDQFFMNTPYQKQSFTIPERNKPEYDPALLEFMTPEQRALFE